MDDQQSPNNNPFAAPESNIGRSPTRLCPNRIHPLLFIPIFLVSIFIGGCTFFCTCLGAIFIDSSAGEWVLWLCLALAVAAMIGSFCGIIALMRRSRRRAALLANSGGDAGR